MTLFSLKAGILAPAKLPSLLNPAVVLLLHKPACPRQHILYLSESHNKPWGIEQIPSACFIFPMDFISGFVGILALFTSSNHYAWGGYRKQKNKTKPHNIFFSLFFQSDFGSLSFASCLPLVSQRAEEEKLSFFKDELFTWERLLNQVEQAVLQSSGWSIGVGEHCSVKRISPIWSLSLRKTNLWMLLTVPSSLVSVLICCLWHLASMFLPSKSPKIHKDFF